MSDRCKHGMREDVCGYCRTQRRDSEAAHFRRSHPREYSAAQGTTAVSAKPIYTDFVTVRGKKGDPSIRRLDRKVKAVHIQGHLFVWLVEEILARCPNIERIQVIPTALPKVSENHRRICEQRGVQIVAGHIRPEMVWAGRNIIRICNPSFKGQQTLMQQLAGEQKALWEEMQAFEFEEAEIVTEYFGLGEEDPVYQSQLLSKYGIAGTGRSLISMKINGVLKYLDPQFSCGRDASEYARRIHGRILRLRKIFESEEALRKYTDTLGLDALPKKLRPAFFEQFETLVQARRDGRMERLAREHPRHYEVLRLHFGYGLESGRTPGEVMRLQEIGDMLNGITRERVRQIEEKGFELLASFATAAHVAQHDPVQPST